MALTIVVAEVDKRRLGHGQVQAEHVAVGHVLGREFAMPHAVVWLVFVWKADTNPFFPTFFQREDALDVPADTTREDALERRLAFIRQMPGEIERRRDVEEYGA